MNKYDAIIIGFGKGGKTMAGYLASIGKRVALIEKSPKMYGGTCINTGCIPTKSLIHSALSAKNCTEDWEERESIYKRAVEEKRRLVAMLRKKNYEKLNQNKNITLINGFASFISETKVQVESLEEVLILEGDHIFINTGSTPIIPEIPGILNNSFTFFSDTLMEVEKLPKHLVIIGGGYIGLEFATMYSNFGSKVTVLQDGEHLIPREDQDVADEIQEILQKKGVTFKLGSKVRTVHSNETYAVIEYEWEGNSCKEEAQAVLIATGRRANTDGLHLEAAGITQTKRGAIVADEKRKTSAPNIWALGDVAGGLQFTYVSLDDYRIVKDQLYGSHVRTTVDRNIPYSVFLDPPFSRVGLNEKEAVEKGYEIEVKTLQAAAIPKAQVLEQPVGFLKAIIEQRTNKILGAMFICEESYELINLIKLAMDANIDYTVLRDQIFTHPTMSEALNDLFS